MTHIDVLVVSFGGVCCTHVMRICEKIKSRTTFKVYIFLGCESNSNLIYLESVYTFLYNTHSR